MWGRKKEPEPGDDSVIWEALWKDVCNKAGADSGKRQNFVASWYGLMVNSGQQSDSFKKWYYILVILTSFFASAVPALIGFTNSSDSGTARVLRIVAAILGVLVAVATSVIGIVQLGNRWRVYRTYSQALADAGWDYLASKKTHKDDLRHRRFFGDKDDKDDPGYDRFVADVARARRAFDRDYLHEIAVLQRSPADSDGKAAS